MISSDLQREPAQNTENELADSDFQRRADNLKNKVKDHIRNRQSTKLLMLKHKYK